MPVGESDDALARRSAERLRDLPIGFDKSEFMALGGTEAGWTTMYQVQLQGKAKSAYGARAIATESGSYHDGMSVEDRQAVLDKVQAEQAELVERVVYLFSTRDAAADEELAQRIAAAAPETIRTEVMAHHRETLERLAAQADHPMIATMFRNRAGQVGDTDPLENVDRAQWERCLAGLAARELGIPSKYYFTVEEHPCVQRAMELVGAISTATDDEVEAHRPPAVKLASNDELLAQRLAAAGERVLREQAAEHAISSGSTPEEAAARAERWVSSKEDPGLWHSALLMSATNELKIFDPEDPIVLRAQELVPGLRPSTTPSSASVQCHLLTRLGITRLLWVGDGPPPPTLRHRLGWLARDIDCHRTSQ